MNGVGDPPGTHALSFSSTTPGPTLVQVYNYAPGVAVSFQLEASGVRTVPPAPASTVAAAPETPGQA
jgi:hypothetical protein